MQHGFGFSGEFSNAHKDVVFTPSEVAAAMVRHFRPYGRVLDPCKGDGAFLSLLDEADYCELQEGRDFFEWSEPVDWIIGNPPYSVYSRWLEHSMKVRGQHRVPDPDQQGFQLQFDAQGDIRVRRDSRDRARRPRIKSPVSRGLRGWGSSLQARIHRWHRVPARI